MNKKLIAVCTLCGEGVYNEKHRCKYEDLKKEVVRVHNIQERQFDSLVEAQAFIKNNTWNIEDKEKIKKLLLIIWNSQANQKFEIKIDLGDVEDE